MPLSGDAPVVAVSGPQGVRGGDGSGPPPCTWLERADRQGVGPALARAIDAAIAHGSVVSTPRRKADKQASTNVPLALQMYAVETPDLRRYDALIERASA